MKNTIQEIKNQVDQLEENLSSFRIKTKGVDWNTSISGEFTYRDYGDNTDFIITQLKYLIKSHKIFAQITTISDRKSIKSYLEALNLNYSSYTYSLQNFIDPLIKLLQPLSFYILSRGKFADDLMIEIGEMLEKKMVLENEILEFENLKQKNEELNQSFDLKSKEIEDKNTALVEKLDRIETTYEELNTKLETAKTESQEITDILTESKSNKGIIDSFVERVSSRQTQLDDQEEKTKAYENKLLEFETEIKTRIDEAKDLIKESEDVLKLNSARGISDHFASQYNVASRWWVFALWLISSLLFLGVAVSIGWLLLSAQSQDLPTVVARISLLPILLTGAYFTANQYVKQKNIAEDYAYKQVLSKSLVGFSREILKQGNNGNPEYQKFMAKVFEQMLQDPLRSRKEKSFEMEHKSENIVDLLTKLISEVNKNK